MPKVTKNKSLQQTSRIKAGKRAAKGNSRNGRKRFTKEFFASFTLEELAKAQGVSPMKDPKKMAGAWPEDEDVDQFVLETYQSRG
jgi:hypothetical protein